MNRLQFLAELKKSLLVTTKEITAPILEGEVEKLEEAASDLIGITWVKLDGVNPRTFQGIQETFLRGTSIVLFSNGETLRAYDKACQSCHSLTQWIAYEGILKCFSCEKTYQIKTETGDLTYKHYSIKEKHGEWFIGM